MTLRSASHAGTWYKGDGASLSRELGAWLDADAAVVEEGRSAVRHPTPLDPAPIALIAPHAGYSYSGETAAHAYRCVDASRVSRIFILGPSHHVHLPGCALSVCDEYETPLGNLRLDLKVMAELRATGQFTDMTVQVDEDEHSIEMHLPYIFKIMERRKEPYTIVPILVGSLTPEKEQRYGRLLAPYLGAGTLFVISSDFCHWGDRFRHTPHFKPDLPIHASIEATDREGMALIEAIDPKGFTEYLARTKNTICGRHPIGVLLNALVSSELRVGPAGSPGKGKKRKSDEVSRSVDRLASAEDKVALAEGDRGQRLRMAFVRYAQSSMVTRPRDSSVSYASAFCRVG